MKKTNESNSLKVESIQVDNSNVQNLNSISLAEQIKAMSKDKELMKKRQSVLEILDELEGPEVDKIEVGEITPGEITTGEVTTGEVETGEKSTERNETNETDISKKDGQEQDDR